MIHLLDTCICIDIIRGRVSDLIERFRDFNLAISSVTFAELEYDVLFPILRKMRRHCGVFVPVL